MHTSFAPLRIQNTRKNLSNFFKIFVRNPGEVARARKRAQAADADALAGEASAQAAEREAAEAAEAADHAAKAALR